MPVFVLTTQKDNAMQGPTLGLRDSVNRKFDQIDYDKRNEQTRQLNEMRINELQDNQNYRQGLRSIDANTVSEGSLAPGEVGPGEPVNTFSQGKYYQQAMDYAAKNGRPEDVQRFKSALDVATKEGFSDLYKGIQAGDLESAAEQFNASGSLKMVPDSLKVDKTHVQWIDDNGKERKMSIEHLGKLAGVASPSWDKLNDHTLFRKDTGESKVVDQAGLSDVAKKDAGKVQLTNGKWVNESDLRSIHQQNYYQPNAVGGFDPMGENIPSYMQWRNSVVKPEFKLDTGDTGMIDKTIMSQAEAAAKEWADKRAGLFSFSSDFSEYGGSREVAIGAKAQEFYDLLKNGRQPGATQATPSAQTAKAAPAVKPPATPEEYLSVLKSHPNNKGVSEEQLAEYVKQKFPGYAPAPVKPVSRFGLRDGLRPAQDIKAEQEAARFANSEKGMGLRIDEDIANTGAQREQNINAMGSRFGIDQNTSNEDRGMAYQKMAKSFGDVAAKIKEGVLPTIEELQSAMQFAQGKGEAQAVTELQSIISKYYGN